MPDITYTLGGTEFDAVPERLECKSDLPVRSETTLGRATLHSVGVSRKAIVLSGQYMSFSVKTAIESMLQSCESTGEPVEFDDGNTTWDAIITSFVTVPLIGKTEGFGFRIELVVVG
jgi:hypothetical protein